MSMQKGMAIAAMLFLMNVSTSCISLAKSSLAPLEKRIYEVAPDCSGFTWYYNKCTKRFLGICLKTEKVAEKIEAEFKDKDLCKTLFDKEFVLRIRQQPI
jgi:hypothetical protein